MNLPNTLTLARLSAVPLVIWLIASQRLHFAFWLFVAAGLTDALDGYLARRLNQRTRLGAYLDALADKMLLMSIYVTFGIIGFVPLWLAILVIFRDLMIMGAVVLSWLLERPLEIAPLFISKLNTTAQIILAALVLSARSFDFAAGFLPSWSFAAVGLLTAASLAAYLSHWIKYMAAHDE